MVTAAAKSARKTVQVQAIAPETTTIRSLDWDRDRFDIEFGLQNGTTYNSFVIKGEKTALIDASHEKFTDLYLAVLKEQIDLSTLDYLIVSHTEPDHSGLIPIILKLAPQAVVVCSNVAAQFLDNMVHAPYTRQIVRGGDTLDLGGGHRLEFVIAPNLHWPDTMFTYDHGTQVLYTCDAFGMHYCDERTYDEDFEAIAPDFRFYYECLMAPNARSVLTALKRIAPFVVETIATGHGPLLRHNVQEATRRYETWSQKQTRSETLVLVFYMSDYGYSDRIAQAIAHGLTKTGVAVEMLDMRTAEIWEVQESVGRSTGLVLTPPPSSLEGTTHAQAVLGTILATAKTKQKVGVFESYGSHDDPIELLVGRLTDAGLTLAFEPLKLRSGPTPAFYQACEESGTDLAQALTLKETIQKSKAIAPDLDKALGTLVGGLYIITASRDDVKSAMLASWISQASFNPPGLTIAVAKDRAIESLLHPGDRFVLNILAADTYLPLMRHFLKRFGPGEDRFSGVKIYSANNGAPVLAEALAYLECQVASRLEAADHWLVYGIVEAGDVSQDEALTAVHYRKVGNHY
ncbi:diflavin flavoprotein [Anthocerotibacter panamensis]|uniref:diflavin flavoprotein n=1 Tax=Anthocerotibacter panamensis TaxID=2857077 RepID=UPI001C4045D1|nr:diflavin flavoprotein [Anthocerotibacter panamensis]